MTTSAVRIVSGFGEAELACEDEAERAHHGRLGEGGGDDARRGQAAPYAALDGLFERGRDDGPRPRDLAADDDRLGREADDEVRDADAEVVRRLRQRVDRRLLAAERALDDLREGDGGGAARVVQVARGGRALRGERLPAVAVPARAGHRRVLRDDHVAELAGRPALAAVDLAVEDDAGADALGDERDDEVARLGHLGPPEPELGERGGVGVVVHARLQTRRALYLLGDGPVAPAE